MLYHAYSSSERAGQAAKSQMAARNRSADGADHEWTCSSLAVLANVACGIIADDVLDAHGKSPPTPTLSFHQHLKSTKSLDYLHSMNTTSADIDGLVEEQSRSSLQWNSCLNNNHFTRITWKTINKKFKIYNNVTNNTRNLNQQIPRLKEKRKEILKTSPLQLPCRYLSLLSV
jgi:hypothetical protein